jgi:hypothetical protein
VVLFSTRARVISLLHSLQTCSGAHPASYPVSAEGSFPGFEADRSPPSCAEVKNGGAIHPLLIRLPGTTLLLLENNLLSINHVVFLKN